MQPSSCGGRRPGKPSGIAAVRTCGAARSPPLNGSAAAGGEEVRVFLFGSVGDPDLYRLDSDLDLAVQGLSPEDFWEAWRVVESCATAARLNLVRLETAGEPLRERILREGELL
jgi:hypothetical protein